MTNLISSMNRSSTKQTSFHLCLELTEVKNSFDHECLNHDTSSSVAYFNEVSHFINLTDLYKVLGTCYYNGNMPYCPVLLEVGQEKIIEFLGGFKYLLQVWDVKEKKNIYQLSLNNPLKCWAISYNYLLFTLTEGNEDSDSIHIVDLSQGNKLIKIKNFGVDISTKFLAFNSNYLIAASDSEIKAIHLTDSVLEEEETAFDVSDFTIKDIECSLNIHGLFIDEECKEDGFILVALESTDNQLDFNQLHIYEEEDDENDLPFEFIQHREKVPRKSIINDPIDQAEVRFVEDKCYAVSKRVSGLIDLYANMIRNDSPEDVYFTKVDMSLWSLYFKSENGDQYWIAHQLKDKLRFEMASKEDEDEDKPIDFSEIHLKTLKLIVNLFPAIHLSKKNIAVVAHGPYISLFDLNTFKWTTHMKFEADVLAFFNITWTNQFISMLLANGQVYYFDFRTLTEEGLPSEVDKVCQLEGEIVRFSYDRQFLEPFFVVTKDEEDVYKVQAIGKEGKIYQCPLSEEEDNQPNLSVICFSEDDERLLLVHNGENLSLYNIVIDNETEAPQLVLQENYGNFEEITGIIHSVVSKDYSEHLILFDEDNGYILDTCSYEIIKEENVFCSYSFQDSEEKSCFALQRCQNPTWEEGFKFLDILSSIKNSTIEFINIVDCEIGVMPFIEVGLNKSRLGFLENIKELYITPFPDRNINVFFNSTDRDSITIYWQIKDKFIIFENGIQSLHTYDVVTGKLLETNKIDLDLSDYRQFNVRGYKTIMFVSNDDYPKEAKFKDFYMPWQLESNTKNQVSFRKSLGKSPIRLFKELEIISGTEIKVHLEFYFPKTDGLNININDQKNILVARDDSGVAIYKAKQIPGEPSYKVQWEIIKVMNDFPEDLQNWYRYRLDFFSPDFSRFINLDTNQNEFFIQDTYTGQEIIRIPQDYMYLKTYLKQTPQMLINRLQWIDNKTLKICNENGVEKLLDVDNNLQELGFNQIPLFNQINGQEWFDYYHIYLSRPMIKDSIKKSKSIYQEYKSKFFLDQNSTINDFNKLLMCNDFEYFNYYLHSFTQLQWSMAESLQDGDLQIKDISNEILEHLIYAIFPNGDTIFHFLCEQQEQLITLLEFCHPEAKKIAYHMPFLPNFENKTPLHICIQKKSFKSINAILKHLSLYPSDHHSKAIKDCYPDLVKLMLPEFNDYMESRIQQNEQLSELNKGNLDENFNGLTTSTPWLNEDKFREEALVEAESERKMKIEILDCAGIFHYNDPYQDKFFDALAATDKFEYFELRSIQTLINFNYPLVQAHMINKLFYPYCAFQTLYLLMIFYAYEQRFDDGFFYYYWALLIGNAMFSVYFLQNEVKQVYGDGLDYFKSFWNYIDLIPLFGIFAILIMAFIETVLYKDQKDERIDETFQRILISIVTLFMWLKFLYFFRIFEQTSYLIRMIVEVVIDMRHFLLVLFVTIIGFGNAFLVLSLGNVGNSLEDKNVFIGTFVDSIFYSYRMALGDFATDEFGEVGVPLVWILFIVFTVFNMIVMLNLLIAIISDSYARVAAVSKQATYQERASMIAENNYLISDSVKKSYAQEGSLILIVTDLEQEDKPIGQDAILSGIENLDKTFNEKLEEMQEEATARQEEVNHSIDQLKHFLLKTMPSTEIQTKIHATPVTKMTLYAVKNLHEGKYNDWSCSGQKFKNCLSTTEENQKKTNPDEIMYHCPECGFDMCTKCKDHHGEIHHHKLEKLTLSQVRERQAGYEDGWGCDIRLVKGCPNEGKKFNDEFSVIYHNADDMFDLCEKCAQFYKVDA